jgi:rhodanese-related sulfurtransferase
VARKLLKHGFDAAVLEGGFNAWRDHYLVEPVDEAA